MEKVVGHVFYLNESTGEFRSYLVPRGVHASDKDAWVDIVDMVDEAIRKQHRLGWSWRMEDDSGILIEGEEDLPF